MSPNREADSRDALRRLSDALRRQVFARENGQQLEQLTAPVKADRNFGIDTSADETALALQPVIGELANGKAERSVNDVRCDLAAVDNANVQVGVQLSVEVQERPKTRLDSLIEDITNLKDRKKELQAEGAVLPRRGVWDLGRRSPFDRELVAVEDRIKQLSRERDELNRIKRDADKQRPQLLAAFRAWNPFAVRDSDNGGSENNGKTTDEARNDSKPAQISDRRDERVSSPGKPMTVVITKAQRKREQAEKQQAKDAKGRGIGRERAQRPASTARPEPNTQPPITAPVVEANVPSQIVVADTRNGEEAIPRPRREARTKPELVSPFQARLNTLVAEHLAQMAKSGESFINGDPQKIFDNYAASLTHPYIVGRIGVPLNDFEHPNGILEVLRRIHNADTFHALNFADHTGKGIYLSPTLTDRLYTEVLYPDRKWKRKPFGFKEIEGLTPVDIVRIVTTPDGDAKIAEGIQVTTAFGKAKRGMALQDRRDFERIIREFPSISLPEAEFSLFAGSRNTREVTEPQQLAPGEELVLLRPDASIKLDRIDALATQVFEKVIAGNVLPLRLVWQNARRDNATVTDGREAYLVNGRYGKITKKK